MRNNHERECWERDFTKLAKDVEAFLLRAKEISVDLSDLAVSVYDRGLELTRDGGPGKEVLLPLHRTLVRPNQFTTIATQSFLDQAMRPEVLFVDEGAAPDFLIVSISVGVEGVFASPDGVPASLFASRVFGPRLKMGVLHPGMFFVVKVVCTAALHTFFDATVVGRGV